MSKNLTHYLTESQHWMDNPVPGDNFAINFREECLVESYILETKKDVIVIQADEEMIRIMESYGCRFQDVQEQLSVDDVLVSEDPTEQEPNAPGVLGAVAEPTSYDPIGEDFMQRMMELAGINRSTTEGDISQVEKDIADAPVAPMGAIDEGVMSEIDLDLRHIADSGDPGELIDALQGAMGSKTAEYLQNMMSGIANELAAKGLDSIINDEDRMLDIMMDRIQSQYDDQDLDEAEYQGRKVPLGKPMRGDSKKFKVYVKDPKTGNVKKVNFGHGGTSAKRAGEKTLSIKKSNPARRRSFRARHNCDNPGPRTKARYWACRAW